MRVYGYDKVGASGGVITYSAVADNGATSTLSYDGTTFTQYLNNGMQLQYTSQGAGASTYTYSGSGKRRTAQESGGTLTTFIWDGEDYLGEY